MKTHAVIASLSILTTAVPVLANSGCYMDMGGRQIDLSHMCGDGSRSTPAPAVDEPTVPEATEEPIILRSQDLASFQVIRIRNDGLATGRVNFTRSASEGTTVRAYVIFMNGSRRYVGQATRSRGQRRVEIQFRLPAGTSLSEVEGEVN